MIDDDYENSSIDSDSTSTSSIKLEKTDYVNFSDCVIVNPNRWSVKYFYAPFKILENEIDIDLFFVQKVVHIYYKYQGDEK